MEIKTAPRRIHNTVFSSSSSYRGTLIQAVETSLTHFQFEMTEKGGGLKLEHLKIENPTHVEFTG